MRMLLTSGGVRNPTLRSRLVDLLGKPVEECSALAVPTASYGHPMAGPPRAWDFLSARPQEAPMTDLGWRSIGVLELTALPSLGDDRWVEWVRGADVLLVNGGDALYLAHWIRESGLAALLPSLDDVVWVGMSAGSMVMTPRIGEAFVQWRPPSGGDTTLGLLDFSIFPHLEHPSLPWNTLDNARRWAATIDVPAYAMDDDTAIVVDGGTTEFVGEGRWLPLERD